MELNVLAGVCGWAFDSVTNNGYGCAHPEQEEVEGLEGRCFSFSCPIAYAVDPDNDGDTDYMEVVGDYWHPPLVRWEPAGRLEATGVTCRDCKGLGAFDPATGLPVPVDEESKDKAWWCSTCSGLGKVEA